jgi:peptidase E
MNTQQPLYLFAGGRGHDILSTMTSVRNLIKSLGKKKPVIAFIGAASLRDNWLVYAFISLIIKVRCNCRFERVVLARPNADLTRAKAQLQKADAVFFSGGDVEAGMQVLNEKGMMGYFAELANQGKLLFGVSAGSIMLSQSWVRWQDPQDDSSAELFSCIGMAPLICDTHAEGDGWVELQKALELAQEGTTGYGINSAACLKVYSDGHISAHCGPVVCFRKKNGRIERQPDLLPS